MVLSPGSFNSAYYEHSFLADQMGVELVEGQDLFVQGDFVYMRTTEGPKRVDVIYRRIDDGFLDPLCFRADSMLGVPGLMNVYRSGGVTICSAPRHRGRGRQGGLHLRSGDDPLLSRREADPEERADLEVRRPDDRQYVLEHLEELVVKEVHGSGGYGMLVGPTSTKEQIADYAERIKADPADFIAQPTLALSTCPTFEVTGSRRGTSTCGRSASSGARSPLPGRADPGGAKGGLAGGRTRSQGGGVKDTWVLG